MRQQRSEYRHQAALQSEKQKGREQPERLPPIRLQKHMPVSRRNGPCPYHPEHKFKKCPHKCMQRIKIHRDAVSGTIPVSAVSQPDVPDVEQSSI